MALLKPIFVLLLLFPSLASAPADVTPIQQLAVLKEMKPDAERVGIVWNQAADRDELLPRIERAAAGAGFRVIVNLASSLDEVGPAFRDLVRTHRIDVLWIVQNDGLVNRQPARGFLLREAARAGVPILAPSPDWVEEGATLALTDDGAGLRIVVNQAVADALALRVPDAYLERTDFVAAR